MKGLDYKLEYILVILCVCVCLNQSVMLFAEYLLCNTEQRMKR